jgi:hypothetical protein
VGRRTAHGYRLGQAAPAVIAAQILGGALGTALAVVTHPFPARRGTRPAGRLTRKEPP